MFKQLINLFIKKNGRSPNALEMLQLKFKAAQQSGKGKVFDMKGNPLDPNKPIIGGTQSEFQSGIIKAIKPKPTVVKQRGPQRGVGAGEQVSAAGATRIKQGFSTQSKLNSWSQNQQWVKDFIGRKNAEFNSLNRADQKSVLDMFEAQIKKHKPKEPLAGGGIAGMLGEPTYEEDNHRVPFKLGGIDKVRRAFLQAMGAGAAGVGAAKTGLFGLLKGGGKKQIVENLTQVPIENAAGMPSWFKPLVNRVIKEGDDITKQAAWKERQIVHSKKLGEEQGVRVTQDLDNQTITVEYQSADNMGGVDDAVRLEYKAAEEIEPILPQHMDPKDPKGFWKPHKDQKTKPTFEANEAWPYADNPFGHRHQKRNITFEGENTVTKVDDLYSDTSALKQFGTGKDLTKQELKIAKQKRKRVNEINNDLAEQDQLLPDPPEPDFATGGRVGMLFGGGVWKKIIENLAKEKGISPSAYLAVTNWKHLPEGIRKIISKSQFEKIKKERIEMFENLVDMAKTRKAFSENIEQGKKTPAALAFEHLEKSFKSPVPHGVTDKDILQGEVILKNLKTGGKKGPELNASGGLAGMLGE